MKSKNHNLKYCINSEAIAKIIIDKLISNTIIESTNKKYPSLISQLCSSIIKKNINTLINQLNISHENDNSFSITEYNITQPIPSKIERSAVYKNPMEKNPEKILNKNIIQENIREEISEKKTIKLSRTKKFYKNNEIIEIKKKRVDIGTLYPFYDIKEKIEKNFTPIYNDEIKEILMKKFKIEEDKKENIQKQKIIKTQKNIIKTTNQIGKYKGKNISVDSDGKIVLIKKLDMNNNISTEFININSTIINHKNRKSRSSIINNKNDQNEIIIKNKEKNENFYSNIKIGKIMVAAGSSFKNFFPEVGVCLKEEGKLKDGGKNFYFKYKKHTSSEFYDIFNNISDLIKNKNNFNQSNVKAINNSSNINNDLNKTLTKTISLPDINSNNNISNILEKNNNSITSFVQNASLIKNEIKNKTMYFSRNSNDKKEKYTTSNYIKISNNLKNIFFSDENNDLEKNNNNFNNIDLYRKKDNKNRSLLNNINKFNVDIISNHNWGDMTSVNNKEKNKNYINIFDYKNKIKDMNNSTVSNFRIRNKNKFIQKTNNIFENSYLRVQSKY